MHTTNCLNCFADLEPDQNFCSNCGQNAHTHPLSLHDLGHDAVHFFTHADKTIFSLVKQLAYKPGIVAREYIDGKRQKYFKPLNFFLLVAGLLVFMTSLFYQPNDSRSVKMEQAAAKMQNSAARQQLLDMAHRNRTVNKITGKYSNVINMLATPFLTLFFWLFYRKKFNYIEALVANLYFVAFTMLVYALVFVPLQHFVPAFGFYTILAFLLFEVVYRGFCYAQLDTKTSAGSKVKAYAVSLLISLIWFIGTYAVIVAYVRNGF